MAMKTVIFSLLVPILLVAGQTEAGYPDALKFDCHPDQLEEANEQNCRDRGCIWDEDGAGGLTPACYYPHDYQNYQLDHLVNDSVILKKTDRPSGFRDDVTRVRVDIIEVDDNRLRIRIVDSQHDRWEPPLPVLRIFPETNRSTTAKKRYNVVIDPTEDGLFLTVTRKLTGDVLLRTDLNKLIFADQFLQVVFNVSSNTLYGLGEHLDVHTKTVSKEKGSNRQRYKFLNHDDTNNREMASYGSHPFYLMYEGSMSFFAHGFLLRNSNPMDMVFTHTPAVTIRTIGGILDFFLFLGPSPVEVLRQKQELLGPAPLPPLWSLGFHLCRYGYESDQDLLNTYRENINAGIPIDAQWADIDYMNKCNMFTIDEVLFKNLPDVIDQIHQDGRHFVPILDPAVSADEPKGTIEYDVFKDGLDHNVYVKNTTDDLVLTRVWNQGFSIFPDFTNPNTSAWWKKNLKNFHNKIKFDGLWIDMNEPSVIDFPGQYGGCPKDNTLDHPQFNPMHPIDIEHKTICMSSRHHLGDHYDLHNLYAFYESKITYELLQSLRNKRPFLLSRATTTGQHVYASHWLGDISSRWDYLKITISGVLNANLFGFPLVGADICGFGDTASDELCARWSSVGAFYTFARNHNEKGTQRQDPASRPGDVLESARNSLQIRYSLLPFLYTLFYHNTVSGDPVLRSLKMNYPSDVNTNGNDEQFMWGTDLLISPVLDQGKTGMNAYYPAGIWYHQNNLTVARQGDKGGFVRISLSLREVGLAFRGGSIIPTQDPYQSTSAQRDTPFNLLVFLDADGEATGQLYWDDGESVDSLVFAEYTLVNFYAFSNTLIIDPKVTGFTGNVIRLKKITIVDNSRLAKAPIVKYKTEGFEWTFTKVRVSDNSFSVQEEEGMGMSLLKDFQITWE